MFSSGGCLLGSKSASVLFMGYKGKSTGCNIDCLVSLEHQTEENNLIRKGFLRSGLRCDKAGPVMVSLYFGFFTAFRPKRRQLTREHCLGSGDHFAKL